MFLIRVGFWVGLAVLLLPTDERQQARLYSTAVTTVERVTTFCDRNAQACAAGAELWAIFVKKAEFGARMAIDLVSSSGRQDEDARTQPFRLTPRGRRLIEKAVPAWEEAQRQATELLGNEGIALLNKAARKLGMPQANP